MTEPTTDDKLEAFRLTKKYQVDVFKDIIRNTCYMDYLRNVTFNNNISEEMILSRGDWYFLKELYDGSR